MVILILFKIKNYIVILIFLYFFRRDNLVASADPNMYTANNKQININNMVTNYNPKNTNGKSNTNTTTDSKLLKPAKCAYI